MDGWSLECIDECLRDSIVGCMDGGLLEWMDALTNGCLDVWNWSDGCISRCFNQYIEVCVDVLVRVLMVG